jgi:metallo-beta-lactamase family protein
MHITLYGAAGDVTGSAYHVQSGRASLLVDFGLYQGTQMADAQNRIPKAIGPRRLDAVLLTHGHLDHVGRLPLLAQQRYTGPVFCTQATREMAGLVLKDSAKVQAHDIERINRRRERAGQPSLDPLYSDADVEAILGRFRSVAYRQPVEVAPGIAARWVEAGHMLGSASIELTVEEGGQRRVVLFSGDLGPWGAPILRDAEPVSRADLVFLESTYGDRDHRPLPETVTEFQDIIRKVLGQRGKILVPTFAIGRTQQILYHLAVSFREGALPKFPVYLDSPMAVEASRIYLEHPELMDEEVQALQRVHSILQDLDSVRATASPEESQALNKVDGPCLIMAGSGMCNGGRILHHLKYNLWRPETAVLIVGYQSAGTLGRLLVEGRKTVKIFGEPIAVKASVHTLGGFSAHAGQTDLLRWFGAMAASRPRVVLCHGEDQARQALAAKLREQYQVEAELAALGEPVTL